MAEIPFYPTVNAWLSSDDTLSFQSNSKVLTIQTRIPDELLDRSGPEVLAELLGRLKEIAQPEQKELTSG